MKFRGPLVALAASLFLALALSSHPPIEAAPAVATWGDTYSKVLYSDTLTHARASGTLVDSMVVTDSIGVTGARMIVVTVTSDGNDSLAISGNNNAFAPQFKLAGGTWQAGLTNFMVGSGNENRTAITNTSLINNQTRVFYVITFEGGTSGTPYPCPASDFRLRLKSSDVRDYKNGTTATNAGTTGRFTVTAFVWR